MHMIEIRVADAPAIKQILDRATARIRLLNTLIVAAFFAGLGLGAAIGGLA